MRSIFGLVSLLVALGIVAVVVKKQLTTSPISAQPGAGAAVGMTPQQTPQQTQQQFKQALDAAMQPAQKRVDGAGEEK